MLFRPGILIEKIEWHYVKGQRGRPQLLINDQLYFRTKEYGHNTYWLCAKNKKYKCMARLWTNRRMESYNFTNSEHNHDDLAVFKEDMINTTYDLEEILSYFPSNDMSNKDTEEMTD